MSEPKQKPGNSKQDYGTPWSLIHAIESRWGSLTIDLAARADNAKAPDFITPEENSLKQDWAERIGAGMAWLNMEFADIEPWVKKCNLWRERPKPALKGSIITLTPASIGSEWFAEFCEDEARVVGLRPRIKFEGCHNLDKKTGLRKCAESWGGKFEDEPILQTWRWDGNGQ